MLGDNQRHGLISVPLGTRPKAGEIPKYLAAFQSHAIALSLRIIDDERANSSNFPRTDLSNTLRRLVTALSTDLEFIRIPIVWAMCNKLVHSTENLKEYLLEDQLLELEQLTDTVGILLSHFDLAQHLNDAERRIAAGDTKIDEALFIEIEEHVHEFDESRARIYTDAAERANRIGAVFALPKGIAPEITVVSYKFFRSFQRIFDQGFRAVFAGAGMAFAVFSASEIIGLTAYPAVRTLLEWVRNIL